MKPADSKLRSIAAFDGGQSFESGIDAVIMFLATYDPGHEPIEDWRVPYAGIYLKQHHWVRVVLYYGMRIRMNGEDESPAIFLYDCLHKSYEDSPYTIPKGSTPNAWDVAEDLNGRICDIAKQTGKREYIKEEILYEYHNILERFYRGNSRE